MSLDARSIAAALGGDVSGRDAILAPGPGHSPGDRSLSVRLCAQNADGFIVHSFAGDDPIECRDYVKNRCGLPATPRSSINGSGASARAIVRREPMTAAAPLEAATTPDTFPARTAPDESGKPKFVHAGDSGPSRHAGEIRRHPYYRGDAVVMFNIKWTPDPEKDATWTPYFRVTDGDKTGWQNRRPNGFRYVPYYPRALNPFSADHVDFPLAWCEGEKDADTLARLGSPAFSFGASTHIPQGAEQFVRGRDLLIFADNDKAGRQSADKRAALAYPVAASVKVISFQDSPKGADVTDWIEAGHTAAELHDLIERAPLWAPAVDTHADAPGDLDPAITAPPEYAGELGPEPDFPVMPADRAPEPAHFVTPADWPDEPPPPVDWIAHHRIVRGDVATLHADGGGGKTQAALQLAWAMTTGAPDWLATTIEPGPVIFLSAEEPEPEIRRRLGRIQARAPFDGPTGGLQFWFPGDLEGSTLAVPNGNGIMTPTPLFASIRAAVLIARPTLVILDNVAAVFGGSQNDRVQVRTFVNLWRALARAAGCGVLLLDHPSLSGLNSGSGRGGNVDWRNAVRVAMHLKPAPDQAEADRGVRVLEMVKNNYAPLGTPVRLEWTDGNLTVEGSGSPHVRAARDHDAEQMFLTLLDERNRTGRHVSANPGRTYAPAVFAESEGVQGYTSKTFARAMERLFKAGRIALETTGPASKRRQYIIRAEHAGPPMNGAAA